MKSFLEVTFSDAVYRLDMEYIEERHRRYIAALEGRAAEAAELFSKDDKYLLSWIDSNIDWEELRCRAEKVRVGRFDTIWDAESDWPCADKAIVF